MIRAAAVIVLILAAVFSAYWDVRHHQFIDIDDEPYLTANRHVQAGFTRESLAWAFTLGVTKEHVGNWHPLTWLSHMLDWRLFGDNAGAHHMVSVSIHALNAVLLLVALWMLSRAFWPASALALLWAVHPLRVESVAWAAERKDVLAAFFGLACLVAYAWHVARPGISRYVWVFVCLTLGLLAKPMLVTWPCLLLLLDVWPLRRVAALDPYVGDDRTGARNQDNRGARYTPVSTLLMEKGPLLLLAIASCVITTIAQHKAGAIQSADRLGIGARVSNAVVSCAHYLLDTVWPTDLAMYYPHPQQSPVVWVVLGALVLLAAITVTAILSWRRAPWIMIGWLWFLGTLVPVIGLLQVGAQARADRYTYLPQIGVLMMLIWTAWMLLRSRMFAFIAIVLTASAVLWLQTRQQVTYWRDTDTMYARALAVTHGNWFIHNNVAARARERNDFETEERHLKEAIKIRPDSAVYLRNLGDLYVRRNRVDLAIPLLEQAIALRTSAPSGHAPQVPEDPGLLNDLAWLLATAPDVRLRDANRALDFAQRACALTDETSLVYPGYLDTLGAAQAATGQFDEALKTADRALAIAIQQDQQDLANQIGFRLRLYQARLPAQ